MTQVCGAIPHQFGVQGDAKTDDVRCNCWLIELASGSISGGQLKNVERSGRSRTGSATVDYPLPAKQQRLTIFTQWECFIPTRTLRDQVVDDGR